MRIGLIGGVSSTETVLEKLLEHNMNIVAVWGYEPESSKNVSGYVNMKDLANTNNICYFPFSKVNDQNVKQQLTDNDIDLLFIVGLSQLVDKDIIDSSKYGCVGFHPTKLPKGRGRAPLAWLVLSENEGAATFFKINEGTDSGPIYAQASFQIEEYDDAKSLESKILKSIKQALDKWLPLLKNNRLECVPQTEEEATYYAKRTPVDGCINWNDDAKTIDKLIKASTLPHPGAYTFLADFKILIWKSRIVKNQQPKGVIGRIVSFENSNPIVQTKDGYLELVSYQVFDYEENLMDKKLNLGNRLGYYDELEIYKLRNEIVLLKKELKTILNKINNE